MDWKLCHLSLNKSHINFLHFMKNRFCLRLMT